MSSQIDGLSLKSIGKKGAASGNGNKSSKVSAPPGTSRTSRTYTPSSTVSTQVREKAIRRIRDVSNADADKIASVLQKSSAATLWQRITSDYGLRSNDMADAMAAYWVINYTVVHELQDVPVASVRGARDQFRRLLLKTPVLAEQSNAAKQRLSEELYFKFLFQHSAFQQANKSGDSSEKARLSSSARTQFRDQMGIDLQRFTLTSAGFVEK